MNKQQPETLTTSSTHRKTPESKMVHTVNIIKLNDQGEQLGVKYTHVFMFEATARKWIEGFNRVHSTDAEDPWISVYVGENHKSNRLG